MRHVVRWSVVFWSLVLALCFEFWSLVVTRLSPRQEAEREDVSFRCGGARGGGTFIGSPCLCSYSTSFARSSF